MIVYFQDYNTDKVLIAPVMDFIPNVGERVDIDKIWYVVVERTFHIDRCVACTTCTIYVKEEDYLKRKLDNL